MTLRFSHLLIDRKGVWSGSVAKKVLDPEIRSVFLELKGKTVVLDKSDNEGSDFRLIVPIGAGQPEFFRHLETFLGSAFFLWPGWESIFFCLSGGDNKNGFLVNMIEKVEDEYLPHWRFQVPAEKEIEAGEVGSLTQ